MGKWKSGKVGCGVGEEQNSGKVGSFSTFLPLFYFSTFPLFYFPTFLLLHFYMFLRFRFCDGQTLFFGLCVFFGFLFFLFFGFWFALGEPYANMGAEGCSASA